MVIARLHYEHGPWVVGLPILFQLLQLRLETIRLRTSQKTPTLIPAVSGPEYTRATRDESVHGWREREGGRDGGMDGGDVWTDVRMDVCTHVCL